MNKVIIVTGGCGFIGRNFIELLTQSRPDYFIVNIDKLTYAGNNKIVHDNVKHYHCCITDSVSINQLIKLNSPEAIVNFAAETHVDNSIKDPTTFVNTNVVGTTVLLNAALKYGVSKFIQISTDEVYGHLGPYDKPFNELTPINPRSPYSASKASADHIVQAYHHTYGIDTCITRCSNNYGPYQHKEKLIPLMIDRALNNQQLPVYGNGLNVRDWLHVSDHCKAILAVLEKGVAGEVYNVGGNNELTNINMVKLILKTLNKSESLISYVEDRKGHDFRYAINSTKIQQELGWKPEVNFESGIIKTIEWYSKGNNI